MLSLRRRNRKHSIRVGAQWRANEIIKWIGKINISSAGCITVVCIADSSWLDIQYSQYHMEL